MDKYDKKWIVMAEKICRREYEKHFNTDLNIPGKMIYGPRSECIKLYSEILQFWKDLLNKYDKQYNIASEDYIDRLFERQQKMSPLHNALATICLSAQRTVDMKLFEVKYPGKLYIQDLQSI